MSAAGPRTGAAAFRQGHIGPLVTAAVAVMLAGIFVIARADSVGLDGFVGAGTTYGADPEIRLSPGHGYDGQFYYRLAVSPFSTDEQVGGIEFDGAPYRQQRIGYPATAWAVTTVLPISTEAALVFINVVAVGVVTYLGARVAVSFGRHASWGLVPLVWPAFLFSLAFDLAEILAAAMVLLAILCVFRHHHGAAASALVAGVLIRETIVVFAAVALVTTRRWVYAIPVAVLAIWHTVVWMMWGALPILDSAAHPDGSRIGLPLIGFFQGSSRWSLIDVAVFTALVAALWASRKSIDIATIHGRALMAYGLLAVVLARPVWESWRGWSRALTEFVLLLFVARVSMGRANGGDDSATALPPPASTPA